MIVETELHFVHLKYHIPFPRKRAVDTKTGTYTLPHAPTSIHTNMSQSQTGHPPWGSQLGQLDSAVRLSTTVKRHGTYVASDSEKAQRKKERDALQRRSRLLQVRDREREIAKEIREKYKKKKDSVRKKAVEMTSEKWHAAKATHVELAQTQLAEMLVAVGEGHRSANNLEGELLEEARGDKIVLAKREEKERERFQTSMSAVEKLLAREEEEKEKRRVWREKARVKAAAHRERLRQAMEERKDREVPLELPFDVVQAGERNRTNAKTEHREMNGGVVSNRIKTDITAYVTRESALKRRVKGIAPNFVNDESNLSLDAFERAEQVVQQTREREKREKETAAVQDEVSRRRGNKALYRVNLEKV